MDQNMIYIDEHVITKCLSRDLIYQVLQDGWCIQQPKWHHEVLIVDQRDDECCLLFVTLLHSDEIVDAAQVQLGKKWTSAAAT